MSVHDASNVVITHKDLKRSLSILDAVKPTVSRADFLKMLFGGAVVATAGFTKELFAIKGTVGHIHAGDPGTKNVEAVYVDGVKIPDAFELDDHEGWVRHFIKVPCGEGTPTVEVKPGHWQERYDLRQCMTHGRVTIKWRQT